MQLVVKKEGKFQFSKLDIAKMSTLADWRYEITIFTWDIRTLEQNNRYRLMIALLADECWYTKDEMHEIVKLSFGETTSVLSKKKHWELQEYVESLCDQLGIILPWNDTLSI